MLRLFFCFRRSFLSSLCLAAVQALLKYFKTVSDHELMPGAVAVIQTISDPTMLPFLWWPDENHRPPQAQLPGYTTISLSSHSAGTPDGGRREEGIFLRASVAAYCRF